MLMCLAGAGAVCVQGGSNPFPRMRQRRDSVCELDFTSNALQSDGNWLSELLSSGTEQLPTPAAPAAGGWADNMRKHLLPSKTWCLASHLQARQQFVLIFT